MTTVATTPDKLITAWQPSGEKCPKCGRETELLINGEYHDAERCKPCGWLIDFTD